MSTAGGQAVSSGQEDHWVRSVDGTVLHAITAGVGPHVVVAHGLGVDVEWMRPFVGDLAGSFSVVAYSRRGHGRSEERSRITLDLEVDDLLAVADVPPGGSMLFGHSYGGVLVLAAGARGCGSALMVYEPALLLEDPARAHAAASVVAMIERGQYREAIQVAMRDVLDAATEVIAGTALMPEEWCERTGQRLGSELAALEEAASLDLGRITQPVAVVVGECSPDHVIDASRRLAQRLPDGEVLVLPDAGHDGVAVQHRVLADLVSSWVGFAARQDRGLPAPADIRSDDLGEVRW